MPINVFKIKNLYKQIGDWLSRLINLQANELQRLPLRLLLLLLLLLLLRLDDGKVGKVPQVDAEVLVDVPDGSERNV